MTGPTSDDLAAFGHALAEAMRAEDVSRSAVAARADVSPDMVARWMRGMNEPPPWRIFAVEELLRLPPGALSRHLGFVPVGIVSVLAAIDADPDLKEWDRQLLRQMYQSTRLREPGL